LFSRIETQTVEPLNQALQDEEEHQKKYLASPFRIRSATEFFKKFKKNQKSFCNRFNFFGEKSPCESWGMKAEQ